MRELVVVGAGPAGLSAALAAKALGADVLVVEAEPVDRVRPGSRALFVHQETLRRLDRMVPGLGARIGCYGIVWRTRKTYYRGTQVFAREFPPRRDGELPPYASLRQVDTERFLLDACHEAGVDFVWGAPVEEVVTSPDHVTIRAEDGRSWKAAYVIGADGARSSVRRSLGIELAGRRSTDYRVAVDLADDDPHAERSHHYRHPAIGRNLMIVPFRGGRQVDVQCLGPDDAERLSDQDEVRRWLPKVLGREAGEVLWVSRYPCLQLVSETFVDPHRRALLVGEAAHLFAPLGARGMNSGIADADEAARAVASRATTDAIEEFGRDRRTAAVRNGAAAGAALRHLRADTWAARTRQAVAARFAPLVPGFGAWLDTAAFGPRGVVTPGGGRY